MADDPTPAERLAEIRKSWPDAARLAEPLALAARIEPELLREVRLASFPRSPALLEAEFYFSPLVAQRTAQWLVLDAALAHELQRGLASAMKRRPAARAAIRRARQIVHRVHASVPFDIAREEEMIWLAVERPQGKSGARGAIDGILRDFLGRLFGGGEQAGAVARWFASAAARLPLLARETPAFAMLGFASSCVLGGRRVDSAVNPERLNFEELAGYLPPSTRRITLWATLTTRGLHVVPRETAAYQPIEVPATNPVLLEVQVEGEPARLVTMEPSEPLFVPLPRTPVAIRTLGRDLLTFRPRPQPPSGAAEQAVPLQSRQARRVYVSDIAQTAFGRKLTDDLRSLGYTVPNSLLEVFERDLRQPFFLRMEEADVMVAALSEKTASVPAETGRARAMGIPVIFVDPDRYRESLEQLHEAILAARRSTPHLYGVPELPAGYVPQPELLARLHKAIVTGRGPTAITGPRREGKTALAAAYARSHEAQEAFPDGIAWFDSGQYEQSTQVEGGRRRLFVFDAVSDPKTVERVLQSIAGRGYRLLTTRDEEVAHAVQAQVFTLPDEFEATVDITPVGMAIVLARKGGEGPTFNLDCVLHNRGPRTEDVQLIQARLAEPPDASLPWRWTVFYEATGTTHSRTREAGPFEVAPGDTRLGIQFSGPPSMVWTASTYTLEVEGWLAPEAGQRSPSFAQKRTVQIDPPGTAQLARWKRASDAEWATLHDEAVGIPVLLSIPDEEARRGPGRHPWEYRISGERFVEAYSTQRTLRDRSGLYGLIERLNDDLDVDHVRVAAYVLATVEDETGGAFHPIERRTKNPPGGKSTANVGDLDPSDVERYRGRGYILIEGRANYQRLSESLNIGKDLVRQPELLLDPSVAYEALRFVMLQGGLTGHPLREFVNAEKGDYFGARRVGFGSTSLAERVAKKAETLEGLLRASLVLREPPPDSRAP